MFPLFELPPGADRLEDKLGIQMVHWQGDCLNHVNIQTLFGKQRLNLGDKIARPGFEPGSEAPEAPILDH